MFRLEAGDSTLYAIPIGAAGTDEVLDAYYGAALPLVAQAEAGLEVMHGSAALTPAGGVVAFCGPSLAGKSTIAYGFSTRGYRHWADDAVAFRLDGDRRLAAVGLPFAPKLRESSRSYFGAPPAAASVVDDYAWQSTPFEAVFLLEPVDDEASWACEVEQLEAAQALRETLSHAYKDRFEPRRGERRQRTLEAYLALVESVPVFRVRFTRDLQRLPDLLDELEACLAG